MGLTVYLHDDSFTGFLTAVERAVHAGPGEAAVAASPAWTPSLFDEAVRVHPEEAAVRRLLDRVRAFGGAGAARRLVTLHLSESPDAGPVALAYVRLLLARGAPVDGYHAHPAVRRMLDLTASVGREIHRFHGLLRFTEIAPELLAAVFEPDHNILLPVARYFCVRLRAQPWIIHDRRRSLAARWDRRRLETLAGDDIRAWLEQAADRTLADRHPDLWRAFFRSVAVPGRENSRVQRQNMPRRYWSCLPEVAERA